MDKKLVLFTFILSSFLLGTSFLFGEIYAERYRAIHNTTTMMVKKHGRSRFPASVGETVDENAPPLMEHFKTLSYVAEGCANSFSPDMDVDCGKEGHMIHLYVAWDPTAKGKTEGKPWLILNKKKLGDFTPTSMNENKPGTHEYYSVCTGSGKMTIHIPTKCSPGLNYSVRIDEDGYVNPVDQEKGG